MRRIVYLCPETTVPVGGVKVIYRHVEALNRLGIPAFVLHPNVPAFRCEWFPHEARFLDRLELSVAGDFVVVPDVWALSFGLQCRSLGLRYAFFVQNGYILYPLLERDAAALRDVIQDADLVLSISVDTDRVLRLSFPNVDPSRLIRASFAVPACFVTSLDVLTAADDRAVTYMPRKLPEHASRVAFMLRPYLPPGWRLFPIDNVDEAGCAALLARSCVFLSFSDLEGLPLPPLEAAVAGNVVVGYTGQGGAEYWDAPNFQVIQQGDVVGFVNAARAVVAAIDEGRIERRQLWPGISRLAQRFSPETEARTLLGMAERIAATDHPA